MKIFSQKDKINIDKNAKIIWNYMKMNHVMENMDAIFILGSTDIRVTNRAAELYHQNFSNFIICSGGSGKLDVFDKSEAEIFSDRLIELGVPKKDILIETKATNTGENITNTRKLLKEKNIHINSFILVQKPYMERRTYATFKKQWPEPKIIVTSPQILFEEYSNNDEYFKHVWIDVMVGDLQRIIEYPKLGFQIEQNIPDDVLGAWQNLINLGFTKYYLN